MNECDGPKYSPLAKKPEVTVGWGIRTRSINLIERTLARLGLLSMIPPPDVALGVGHGDFVSVGNEFLRHFTGPGGLRPTDNVLDIGCGTGRMAVPLTRYLHRTSLYRGFDVDRAGVVRCQNRITPRFPNFRFDWADVYNQAYNPGGHTPAREYTFPHPDGLFDFAFLTSVFTHMLPADVARFTSEIARVLKPGGRCFATFFVLNDESEARINRGESRLPFADEVEGCRVVSRERPEDAIAYPEAVIRAGFAKVGLQIPESIHYGAWSGRTSSLSYQDVVIAIKAPAATTRAA